MEAVKSYPGKTLADRFAACAKHLWRLTDDDVAAIRRQLAPVTVPRTVLPVVAGSQGCQSVNGEQTRR